LLTANGRMVGNPETTALFAKSPSHN